MMQELPEIVVKAKKLCPRCVIVVGFIALFLINRF